MSDNILQIPLNAEGALEMGLYPCTYCNQGWGNYSVSPLTNEVKFKTCSGDCEYLRRYREKYLEETTG